MTFITCPKCGTPSDSRNVFCGNCGNILQASNTVTSTPLQEQPQGTYPSTPYHTPLAPPPPPYGGDTTAFSKNYTSGSAPTPYIDNLSMATQFATSEQQQPSPKRRIMTISLIVAIVLVVGVVLTGILAYGTHKPPNPLAQTHTAMPAKPVSTSTTLPTTPIATNTSVATTPQATTTLTTASTNGYSTIQPGPGCDKNGGVWNAQGLFGSIACNNGATQLSITASQARGYLYLQQLPNNQTFAASNTISITGDLGNYDPYNYNCVGLAEQDASRGYLAEYCNNGGWSIYEISNVGAIIKLLDKSITSTRTTEITSLTLKGKTLSFTIDTEVHTITVSPIQPTEVALTYYCGGYANTSISINSFSYTTNS